MDRQSGFQGELRRHLNNLRRALSEASKHLEQGEARQTCNLAWRKAVAYVVTLLLADPSLRVASFGALRGLPAPPVDVHRVAVAASNAPKTLKTLIGLCRELSCGDNVVKLLEFLEEARPTAYMLHTAFYEGSGTPVSRTMRRRKPRRENCLVGWQHY